jgi:hypothetical protein
MEQHAPVRREHLLDRDPGDLVTEAHGVALGSQDAGGEAGD